MTNTIPSKISNCLNTILDGNGNSFVLTLYGNVKQNKEDVMNYLEKNSKNYSCIDITTNDDDKWNSLINKSCQIKEVENEMLKGNIENKKRIILYMFPDIFYYVQTIKNQSNLYNLLNYILMEDNDETQRVVIAFTEQVDFTEHLEKRVLSRFTQLSLESTWRTRDNSMEQEQDNGMSFIQDSLARLNQIQFRLLVYMLNIYSLNYKEFIKNKNHKIIDYITYEQIIEIFEKKHWKDQSSFSTSTLQDILISHVNLSLVVLIDFGLVHNENPISTSNYSLNQTDIVQGHYLINVDWDDLCDYMEKNEKLGNFTQIPMDVRIIIESKGTKLLI
ncbi:hypothetical protein SNEBB_002598 [Seison nebaliae]|nr:hypothetical protein SNEBB_002598 [Seison nebaliae]